MQSKPMSISVATEMRRQGKPWLVKLEFVGSNWDNMSGRSSKYWQASGAGSGGTEVRWGKIGSSGQSVNKDWSYFQDKVYKKMDKGYEYAPGTAHSVSAVGFDTAPTVKLEGPFAMICELVQEPAGVLAFDAAGKKLMKLTHEAGAQIANQLGIEVQ